MKALDFVRTPKGAIALVTETNECGRSAAISFIGENTTSEHNAWWDRDELEVIDSLPRLLATNTKHPLGRGEGDVKQFFPIK